MRIPGIVLLLSLLTSVGAQAQPFADSADSLQALFRAEYAQAARLLSSLDAYSSEDSIVIRRELETQVIQTARVLNEFSRSVEARRAKNPDSSLDPEILRELDVLGDQLDEGARAIRLNLDHTRKELRASEGRARAMLVRRLGEQESRLTLVNRLLLGRIEAMERMGVEQSTERLELANDLIRRADLLVGRIRLAEDDARQIGAAQGSVPDDAELIAEQRVAEVKLSTYVNALDGTVQQLRGLDQQVELYETTLVEFSGDLARGLLNPGVATRILEDWVLEAREWLAKNGLRIALKGLVAAFILLLAFGAARVVRRTTEKALDGPRVRVSHLLRKMLVTLSGNLVLLVGVLVALSQLGVSLAPVLAGVGVVGFIVGFALQDTLANFAAGIMILFYRPYDVHDMVEVSGVFGKVSHMSLVSTTILTIDNQTLVVPNGKIWGDVIRNVTAQRIRRIDLVFGISYSDDIEKAERVLMEILEGHEKVLKHPEPMVKLHTLNDSSVDFVVRPWSRTDDYWDIHWDITRAVKMRFDEEEISIPFPQRDVHHHFGATED